jgi:hypothetical protein
MAKITIYEPSRTSLNYRVRLRYSMRLWSVQNSRFLEWFYSTFARVLLALHPVWKLIGYQRIEGPMVAVEKRIKAFMFDCNMCGLCALSSTGMSCPMNCPKSLRNGPCGGVRANGHCEVEPDMPCVWVQAWQGSRQMKGGDAILNVQPAVDFSLQGTSSWLRVTSEAALQRSAQKPTNLDTGKATCPQNPSPT